MSRPFDSVPESRPLRGSLKLEAAIDAFRLDGVIRGATVLDVGASHGGFTRVLLDHGARHVDAVDVGHGQMREPLRSDPRVALYEGVHFKKLPPRILPGPFDFFTVDVSFVAARTMLRGVALRLRRGAEGVVLVKPQFELPDHLVPPGGVVADDGLRGLAWGRFKPKALALGFSMEGKMDSPVSGGDGNVEFLAWLRFDAIPEKGSEVG